MSLAITKELVPIINELAQKYQISKGIVLSDFLRIEEELYVIAQNDFHFKRVNISQNKINENAIQILKNKYSERENKKTYYSRYLENSLS